MELNDLKKDSSMHLRVNKELREEAEKTLDVLGLSLSAVIDMLFRQIILTKGCPFPITIPEENMNETQDPEEDVSENETESIAGDAIVENTNVEEELDTSDIDEYMFSLGSKSGYTDMDFSNLLR